ncbi:MAG TPA: general secretion pathway protein GspH [Cyanobacteria bacterium UBA11149]|nr:general secretion pathway protein GspH [Cyanobacteria bacterium UBA11367]HBE59204.1 general secretion pathway protein GspH [Cyanobacteria bacterium UBA11366]HBR73176.1 general secretion pathway protein GspH [Cyanobacteria bacterium UBA11159]HBS69350.1 general secretion pathway protein GspH [Cyanobacteria bacterium UBA11153]HBW88548.1 general secretion pathway protein GspH [Cyanobacteria bacterium UBA11149]
MWYQQTSNKVVPGGLLIVSILGIGSIALPSFLNQSQKACACGGLGSEAKQYIGAMNRAQQAYFLENNAFTNNIEKLGLGIKTETENYSYSTHATDKAAFNYGISRQVALRSWVGGVFTVPATDANPNVVKGEMTTLAILCEANSPGTNKPAAPTYQNGVLACGEGTTQLR